MAVRDNPHLRVKTEVIVQMFMERGMSLQAIADEVGLSKSTVYWRLVRAGVETSRQLKPVGCPRCKTEPYARDLCHACYVRDRKRKRKANELLRGPIRYVEMEEKPNLEDAHE